jgi:ATP-dependent Clp endopeptidase proteolytic subunit ClpP
MSRFWNFIRNEQSEDVELRISGDIVSDDYAWIYEWYGIAAASPNSFRNELAKYKGKNITVWIDSDGGDVFAGAGIFDALKSHDGKVTVKITKAISAASVIAMAGDEIHMSPVGIMMIHNPLTGTYGEAKDMRHAADVLDEVKETIMNAYQIKTGKPRNKISELMDNESFMSAKTALAEGFIDKILYADAATEATPIENNFSFSRLAIQNSMDNSMKKFFEIAKDNPVQNTPSCSAPHANVQPQQPVANITNNNQKEANTIMNKEELRTAYPDLVADIENSAKEDGRTEERQRIKAIEEISNNIDPELVNKAKFEEPMNAEKLAFEAMKKDGLKGQEYLNNVKTEVQASGTQNVAAAANNVTTSGEQKPQKIENVIAAAGAKFERARKGEK